jgi:hypothetical protein
MTRKSGRIAFVPGADLVGDDLLHCRPVACHRLSGMGRASEPRHQRKGQNPN